MNNEAMHHMLITMCTYAATEEARSVAAGARLKLEEVMLKDLPLMTEEESSLNEKHSRIEAYKKRTGVSTTIAHIVVNRSFVAKKKALTQ